MARGSVKEEAVSVPLLSFDFVSYNSSAGRESLSTDMYFAASLDGIAMLQLTKLFTALERVAKRTIQLDVNKLTLAIVEIKPRIPAASHNAVTGRGT